MSARSLTSRFARNAGFNLLGRLWYISIWIWITPYVLQTLGVERFGVWSILFLVSGYLATFDLGLGTAVVRFTAEAAAHQRWGRLRRTLRDILRLYALLGVVWIAALLLGQHEIVRWLKVSPNYEAEVRFALLASGAVFAFANVVTAGSGVLQGLQRMDLSNAILVGSSLPQFAVLWAGLQAGYGLYAVVASTAVQWVGTALATAWAIRRVAPDLRQASPAEGDGPPAWFRFSARMQANNALVLTQQQIDKVFLTTWAGLRWVTEFELGFRIANALQSIPMLLMSPLIPAFTELDATGDRARFRAACRRGTVWLFAGSFGVAAAAIPAAPGLLAAWVGAGHAEAHVLCQWMIAAFALNLTTGVASAAFRGTGRPELELWPLLAGLLVHAIVSPYAMRVLGPTGVGVGLLLGTIVTTGLYWTRFARWLEVSFGEFFGAALASAAVAFVPALGVGLFVAALWPRAEGAPRMVSLAGAMTSAAAAAVVFAGVWWRASRSARGDGGG